jgi:hypothetical protein
MLHSPPQLILFAFRRKQTTRPSARVWLEQLEVRNLLSGFTPAQIRTAYAFPSSTTTLKVGDAAITPDGGGQTIAIVDAFDDPTIVQDAATFDKTILGVNDNADFLTQVYASGTQPGTNAGWSAETALDVEWAHAIAPAAKIVLVEAASDSWADLLQAVQVAGAVPGVAAISMSWGGPENDVGLDVASFDATLKTISAQGTALVAAAGDNGSLFGVLYPSSSPYVMAVGGTTLQLTHANTIRSETAWSFNWMLYYFFGIAEGGGGGVSAVEPEPAYQQGVQNSGFRTTPDVAYDANPATGLVVVDSQNGGTYVVGGTSVGAPQYAALIAVADQARLALGQPPLTSTQALTAIYGLAGDFRDITSGNTGLYSAHAGYDLATGMGSPRATQLIVDLATTTVTGALVTVTRSAKQGGLAVVAAARPNVVVDTSGGSALTPGTAVSAVNALQAAANSALPAAPGTTALVGAAPSLAQPVAVIVLTPPLVLRFDGPTATGAASIEPEALPVIGSVPTEANDVPALPPAVPAAVAPAAPVIEPPPAISDALAANYAEVPFAAAFDDVLDFTQEMPVMPLSEEGDGAFAVESGLVAAALLTSLAWNVRPAAGQPEKRRWFEYAAMN